MPVKPAMNALLAAFLSHLPKGQADAAAGREAELTQLLEAMCTQAAAELPGLAVERATLLEHLAERVSGAELLVSLRAMRAADVLLAAGCLSSDAAALGHFDA